jgi:hypothetical protein
MVPVQPRPSRKPVLEGMMNGRSLQQPGSIAGPPWDTGTSPSRRLGAAATQESSARPAAPALPGAAAARILEELDVVVRNSHRPSVLRRMLHKVGSALARLSSRMVPEPPLPPQSDLPPEIWFPWSLL